MKGKKYDSELKMDVHLLGHKKKIQGNHKGFEGQRKVIRRI